MRRRQRPGCHLQGAARSTPQGAQRLCSMFLLALGLMLLSVAPEAARSPQAGALPAATPAARHQGEVAKYCVTCHNDRLKTSGVSFEKINLAHVGDQAEVWEKAVRKLRGGMMPPQGAPRPDAAAAASLRSWLEQELDRAAVAQPNPGRPMLHRLNRVEYGNAVRDLLALNVDIASLLPPDDSGYGFDNIADLLGVSPVLLERYLEAAGRISDLAVGDRNASPTAIVYRVRQDASQDKHIEGLPLGTVGGTAVEPTLPLDGEYELRVKLFRTNLGTMRGLEYPQRLEIAVDGQQVHLARFGGNEEIAASSDNPTTTGNAVDERLRVRLPLTAGPHKITVAFLAKPSVQGGRRLQPWQRSSSDTVDFAGYPHVDTFTVAGPFNPTGVGDTPSRRAIFICRPSTADETPCARRIITALSRRAYRGLATDADVQRLLDFFVAGRRETSFDEGVAVALRRMLTSPKFLFRAEHDPDTLAPGSVFRVSDLELASRLSFFLWSSIPDDELLDLAAKGRLRAPGVLDQQVRRMLADGRSQALIDNFAGQWLYLRNLPGQIPNSNEFPDFDDNLRQAFRRESELFFNSIVRENQSIVNLLTANYTFVNERLAKHYGIPNVYGSQFRRVTVTDANRMGLLGQGAVLMTTSLADRTSPVRRGKWILENILGTPPPPPPDNVPPLKDKNTLEKPLTMRAQMEEHRANAACASCHKLMDPIGLSLEHFDAVGKWRVTDEGQAIDPTGQLADGTRVDGPVSLRQALLRQPEVFAETFTEKLLTYALGRGAAY
jgi:cytochrome c551/c552